MAWGRLALIHAAGESDETLEKIAQLFGYEHKPIPVKIDTNGDCLLYTSPSPRDGLLSRMPSSA